jgi:hypothetical protein
MSKNNKNEAPMNWDVSDTPEEPMQSRDPRKAPPIPVRVTHVKDASGRPVKPPKFLPGATNAPYTRTRQEARAGTATLAPTGTDQTPPPGSSNSQGGRTWMVTVPGLGEYRVEDAGTAEEAKQGLATWFQEDQEQGQARYLDPKRFTVRPAMAGEGVGAAAMGGQAQTASPDEAYEARLKEAIRAHVREVVRKKAGGGGYVLYGPNKGKKKNPKPAGEFPTRLAAKRAELARFPPKDPEQLKKMRSRLDKLNKDPKKRAAAELKDLTGRKAAKKSGSPAGSRKKKTEAIVRMMVRDIQERLFRDEEVPGSPWDERIDSLHPEALASDKKLAAHHKNMETASIGALGDAHKSLAKALRGMAKVHPGDVAHDPERRKTFMPVNLDVDGDEIGPIHLYVDGGHVKIEMSPDAREAIGKLEPPQARDLRGGLMSFEEDYLPRIDRAKKAWNERDAYLDKMHGKLKKQVGGMSDVESHLARQLLNKNRRR